VRDRVSKACCESNAKRSSKPSVARGIDAPCRLEHGKVVGAEFYLRASAAFRSDSFSFSFSEKNDIRGREWLVGGIFGLVQEARHQGVGTL